MNLKFGNVASVIKYRIAAKILSSPAGVAWLTSQKQLPAIGPKTVGFGVASKEIFDLVTEEFANEPELLKTSLALLERNNAEYAERLEEDKAYRQMLIEKGGAVDIFPEFNTPEQTPVEVTPSRIRGPEDFQAATGQPASDFAGVNTASRLANPNVFAPAGMVGSPTMNPTLAKGQALFPDSITFRAAQGGIVSAAKPKQRVI
jgi:hypothetical protein